VRVNRLFNSNDPRSKSLVWDHPVAPRDVIEAEEKEFKHFDLSSGELVLASGGTGLGEIVLSFARKR